MTDSFHAGGGSGIADTPEALENKRRIKALVNQIYANRLRRAGFLARMWWKLVMYFECEALYEKHRSSEAYKCWSQKE